MIRVGIEMEKLKNLNSGLGQFCLHLGKEIAQNSQSKVHPTFYLPKKLNFIFGKECEYKFTSRLHKLANVRFQGDVWHCTHQQSDYFPANKKIKNIITIHDLNFLEKYKSKSKQHALLSRLKRKIDRSAALVFISEYTASAVKEHFDISGKRTAVIHNGNTLVEFPNAAKPKFAPDGEFIFSLGIINPKKNFLSLLPLLKHNKKSHLIIAGINYHPYAQEIISAAKKENLENRLILPGTVTDEEKYWLYKNCFAFAFPSLAEGFGLPVIEAMSVGKPVFISDKTSLPEIGGKEAYYFRSFDADHMAGVFENGMKEYNRDAQKPSRITKWAEQFSWRHAAKKYIELYCSL